jgi:branched-chain amino acid transport system ATP-binding protein
MLDEPSQGLAPLVVADVYKIVSAARAEGTAVLLVEQNVRAAVEIADRAYVIDDGRIVYEGNAREFGRDEQRVRELAGASAEKWDMDAL